MCLFLHRIFYIIGKKKEHFQAMVTSYDWLWFYDQSKDIEFAVM